MKHSLFSITVVGAMLAMSACSTGSSSSGSTTVTPTSPVSTLDITFNGHTHHFTSSTNPLVSIGASTQNPSNVYYGYMPDHRYGDFLGGVTLISKDMEIEFSAQKLGTSSALGVYRSGSYKDTITTGATTFYGALVLVDITDGGKRYESSSSGNDTNSTITYTVSNATQVKGTFSVVLSYSNSYYPATGSFEFNK